MEKLKVIFEGKEIEIEIEMENVSWWDGEDGWVISYGVEVILNGKEIVIALMEKDNEIKRLRDIEDGIIYEVVK